MRLERAEVGIGAEFGGSDDGKAGWISLGLSEVMLRPLRYRRRPLLRWIAQVGGKNNRS